MHFRIARTYVELANADEPNVVICNVLLAQIMHLMDTLSAERQPLAVDPQDAEEMLDLLGNVVSQ